MKYYKNQSLMCPVPSKREQKKENNGISWPIFWINFIVDEKICLNYEWKILKSNRSKTIPFRIPKRDGKQIQIVQFIRIDVDQWQELQPKTILIAGRKTDLKLQWNVRLIE